MWHGPNSFGLWPMDGVILRLLAWRRKSGKEPTREMDPLYAHDNTPTWVRSQSMPISWNMAMASVR